MSAPVRFGYGFDLRNPKNWQKPWPDVYAEALDFICATEDMGFEQVWFAEHHGIDDGYLPSPLMIGAAVASRTKKVRISSGVALAPFYHPVRLAEDMAVLDNISNGRADYAPGIGYLPFEAEGYGFNFKTRARRSDEILQIIRRLWEGETVTFEGEFYNLKNARCTPPPVQRPSIPLFIGGTARPGLRRAARYGDGYVGPVSFWPEYVEEVKACGKDEKDARIVSMDGSDMWFVVTEDPEKTLNEVAPHYHYQINQYAEWQEHADLGIQKMDLDTFKQSGMMKIFTPDQAIDYIRSRIEMAPIEAFCMQVPAGFPLSKMAEHAELFANKVLPAFR